MSTFIRIRLDRQTEEKLRDLYDRFGCTAEAFAETAVAAAARQFSGTHPARETPVQCIVEGAWL